MSEKLTITNNVFFDPCGDQYGLVIQDQVLSNGVGMYSGKTLEEYQKEYPLMMIVNYEQASVWINDFHTSEPVEINEEIYMDMLEVLPPVGWSNIGGKCESFKMSERLCGDITGIYARIGDRYFTFNDDIRTRHDSIIDKVINSAVYKAKQ